MKAKTKPKYFIGNWEFRTKADLLEFTRNIVNSHLPKQRLNEDELDFMLALLSTNQRFFSKEAYNTDFITVVLDEYNGKCLELTLMDGSTEIFSYHKLIKEL